MKILIEKYIYSSILSLPHAEQCQGLVTDACNVGVGCTLLEGELERPRKVTGRWSFWNASEYNVADTTQRNYFTTEWAVLPSRPYVAEAKYILRDGHDSLNWKSYLSLGFWKEISLVPTAVIARSWWRLQRRYISQSCGRPVETVHWLWKDRWPRWLSDWGRP